MLEPSGNDREISQIDYKNTCVKQKSCCDDVILQVISAVKPLFSQVNARFPPDLPHGYFTIKI